MNYSNEFYNLFYNEKKIPINIPINNGTNYLNVIRNFILSYNYNVDKNFIFLDKNNKIIKKDSENIIYLAEIINNKNIQIKEGDNNNIIKNKYYFFLNTKNIFDDELNSTETLSNIRQKYKIFIPDDAKFINSKKEKINKIDENNKKIEDIVIIKKNNNNNIVNLIKLESKNNNLNFYNIYINEKKAIFYFLENSFLFEIRNYLEKKITKKDIINLSFLNTNKNYEIINKNQEENIKIKEITNENKNIFLTNKLIENSDYIPIKNSNNFLYFQYPQEIYKKKINSNDININNIIVFGQTGSGKTTLINRLTNFMNQIKFEDKIKYKLILEKDNEKGSSKTKIIDKYFIKKNFNNNFNNKDYNNIKSMIIIDTPGFGDNRDINIDFKISKMAKKIFEEIKFISAVIFVINKNDFKIDSYQNYIFDSVFNLFGNNIINNIFFFITHCDNYLNEIEKNQIENNLNFLLKKFLNISINDYKIKDEKIYYISNNLDRNQNWNESEKKYLKFFNYLNNVNKIDLNSTIENLEKRENLNKNSQNLVSIIDECNEINKKMNDIKNKNKKLFEINFNKTLSINNRYNGNNNNNIENNNSNIFNLNNKKNNLIFSEKKIEMEKLCENLKEFELLNQNVQKETKNLMKKSFNKNLFYSNKEYIIKEFIKREENKDEINQSKQKIESCNNLIKVNEILKKIHDNKNFKEVDEAKKKKDIKILKQIQLNNSKI